MGATVGVALRGHPYTRIFWPTGGHGGPPLQLRPKKLTSGVNTRQNQGLSLYFFNPPPFKLVT